MFQCLCMAGLLVVQKPILVRIPPTSTTALYYTVATGLTAFVTACSVPDSVVLQIKTRAEVAAVVYGTQQSGII